MQDNEKTKERLVHELTELRSQNADLKKSVTGSISAEIAAEVALRHSESIVEAVREPLLVLDSDLKIISANRNFYRTFKLTPIETIGSFIYDLGNKQWDIPKLRELLEEVLPEKEAFDDFEVAHTFQDIGHKIMLLNARQIYRKDIGAKMILLAIEDITEQKMTAEKLLKSESDLRMLIAKNADGLIIVDVDGILRFMNPAAESLFGQTTEKLMGKPMGLPLVSGEAEEMDISAKDGTQHTVEMLTVSINWEAKEAFLISLRDITERKQAEEKLRESEEKYRLVVENAKESILIAQDMKLVFVNRAAMDMMGYSTEILTSKFFKDFIHPDDLNMVVDHYIKRIKGEEVPPVYSFRILVQDGTVIWCEINAAVIQWEGKPATLNFLNNITERKKTEEELHQTLESLRKAFGATIQVMVSAIEMRDPYTAGHQLRVANIACTVAMEMGLSQDKIDGIRMAGSIHDIGKLSIPAEILSKPTKLTNIEFSLIKEHSQTGYDMLKDVESPWPLAQIVYQHHERMDGSGYPKNLKGDEILMEARIMAVADVVEAMASHRPYRPGLGIDAALAEIEKNKGIFYDNTVADACLRLFREKGYQLPA